MIEAVVLSALLTFLVVGPVSYYLGRYDERMVLLRRQQIESRLKQASSGGVHMSNIRCNGDVIATVEVSNSAEVDQ